MSSLSHGVTIPLLVTSLLCFEPANGQTPAHLTINSFEEGGDGGGPSECDGKYHSNDKTIVALSTPWYAGGSRCLKHIMINGNGRTVRAKVVDECDTSGGCRPDIVDASRAVWLHLGVAEGSDQWGWMDVTWWDAGD